MSQTVADFFWARLHEWGVRRVFGYPGDGINGLLAALQRMDGKIELVQVRHEEMAAFMATAHAKFTGELGVCLATSGPGRVASVDRTVRCPCRSHAGAGDRRAGRAVGDRRALPAGTRPGVDVQGCRGRVHRHGDGARAGPPSDRRAVRIAQVIAA